MTKDMKKVEVAKRLAEYNHRKRKELVQLTKAQSELKLTLSHYYGAGAIVVRRSWLLHLLIQGNSSLPT